MVPIIARPLVTPWGGSWGGVCAGDLAAPPVPLLVAKIIDNAEKCFTEHRSHGLGQAINLF
jgi:hypothetical protein